MPELNRCDAGGWVVGAEHEVPEAPEAFSFDERVALIGCNHLVCGACGAVVRSRVGVALASPSFDRSGIVERGEWDEAIAKGFLEVEAEPRSRTYLCRCNGWSEDDRRALDKPSHWDEFLSEHAPPWRCGLHPRPALPYAIGDATWSDEASAIAVARRFLAGDVALPAYLRRSPGAALVYAYSLFRDSGVDLRIAEACAAGLEDADARVRARAADFFRLQPEAPGAERAVKVLTAHPAWFLGVQDALESVRAGDERVQNVVGMRMVLGLAGTDEVALAGGLVRLGYVPNDVLARGLAEADRAGFIAQLGALLEKVPTPAMATRLIAALARKSDDDMIEPLASLAERDLVPRDVFKKGAKMLVDPPWRQALLTRLG